jgi:hypothetical protein
MKFEQLKKAVSDIGISYFVHPREEYMLLGMTGIYGRYQIGLGIDQAGSSLGLRTHEYANYPANGSYAQVLIGVLNTLNDQKRLIKYSWDQKDGEIIARADLWLADATPTPAQLRGFIGTFVVAMDVLYPRVMGVCETGTDPGDPDAATLAQDFENAGKGSRGGLRALLDKLRGRKEPAPAPAGGGISEI